MCLQKNQISWQQQKCEEAAGAAEASRGRGAASPARAQHPNTRGMIGAASPARTQHPSLRAGRESVPNDGAFSLGLDSVRPLAARGDSVRFGERCRALHGIPRSLRAQLFRLFSPSNLISIVPCTESRLLTAAGLPSVCGVSLAGVPGAPRAARALPLPDGRASTPTSSVSLDVRLFQTENLPLIHLCDFNNSNATLCSERISASPE